MAVKQIPIISSKSKTNKTSIPINKHEITNQLIFQMVKKMILSFVKTSWWSCKNENMKIEDPQMQNKNQTKITKQNSRYDYIQSYRYSSMLANEAK